MAARSRQPSGVLPTTAGSRPSRKTGTVKNEGKLVLLFLLLVGLVYTVIIRKHIYMPIDVGVNAGTQHGTHRQQEKANLRAEFHGQQDADGSLGQASFAGIGDAVKAIGGAVGSSALWSLRRDEVVQATKDTWRAYEANAMGFDELMPVTKMGKNNWGSMGATVVDSLDTLWLMGLKEEFDRARAWVAKSFMIQSTKKVSLFETTIRIVGGFLSAYDLTGDALFLEKAQEIVERGLPYFEGTTGIPPNSVVLKPSLRAGGMHPSGSTRASLAEYGTLTVEYIALSLRTGNPVYGQKAEAMIKLLRERYPDMGLLPVWISRSSGKFTANKILTVGAMADSYYEYLLKVWLLKRKQEEAEMYRAMWEQSMDECLDKLVRNGTDGLLYVGSTSQRPPYLAKMEHLACYLPGNLALGVAEGAVKGAKGERYMTAAKGLTETCWQMYAKQATGLSPEYVWFNQTVPGAPAAAATATGMKVGDARNDLRPEAVESLYYLWRITGDVQYREWGWAMFQSFQKYCRLPDGAYSGWKDVRNVTSVPTNGLETFWLAETLKYFWLLFGPADVLPWDQWVFNTEAHPVKLHAQASALVQNAAVVGQTKVS